MPAFLINAIDRTHADPAENKLCVKRGDTVLVRETGFQWSRKEVLPDFYQLTIVGLSLAAAQKYIFKELEDYTGSDGEIRKRTTRFRQYRIHIDELPADVLSTLESTGVAKTDWASGCNCFENKTTGVRETV